MSKQKEKGALLEQTRFGQKLTAPLRHAALELTDAEALTAGGGAAARITTDQRACTRLIRAAFVSGGARFRLAAAHALERRQRYIGRVEVALCAGHSPAAAL
eukprot:6157840-Pleurochrysis_carterae.AAC.3